ncbi:MULTISPECIES: hypothetical protein [unclassified Nocardia]|uniref:hypothetical protein n=1 Tax=unclassified Nocardia TaxID=2637762 RepID=UPI0024A9F22D|nr:MULTISPECIES: hypothetical protein [unclassified Nocardia]
MSPQAPDDLNQKIATPDRSPELNLAKAAGEHDPVNENRKYENAAELTMEAETSASVSRGDGGYSESGGSDGYANSGGFDGFGGSSGFSRDSGQGREVGNVEAEEEVPKDPLDGAVSHGKNSLAHMRKHAQHIRTAARADGVEIPSGAGKPETQEAIKKYIQYVVDNPHRVGVGRYMSVEDAIWSQRGDLIIVRKSDGEWITALSEKSGGAAGGAPWKNPNPAS